MDIGVPSGTPIHAADSGTVRIASYYGGYGNYTCIQHSASLSTCYGHQSSFAVSVGQNVSQGQVIGYVGCTGLCFGAHLHFEVRVNGSVVDPMGYL
jgi:murein DD-endopeptidase MepM/ murein hydrolase activator NlpD